MMPRLWLLRLLIAVTAALGINYIVWRWLFSVNWAVWWISVPLVTAETFSLLDSLLFGITMWRLRRRPDPGAPPAGLTVDVFITTYNEPLQLVRNTVLAAKRITYPHTTWILDDGNRAEIQAMAAAEGIGCVARSADWFDRPKHAKAGNLNNALMATQGEFLLILDADQVPSPVILDRTLGYFSDEQVAVVQTPQFFANVLEADPLGSQAPLFYGPIQQGKDGWNAAFFCGSNAVLRREALMQLGVSRYVVDLEKRITKGLANASAVIDRARSELEPGNDGVDAALVRVGHHVREARADLRRHEPLADITVRFQRDVAAVAQTLVRSDDDMMRTDLLALGEAVEPIDELSLQRLARRDLSPLAAIASVRAMISSVDVDREDEAQPIMPMSVISVTEDLATCMRLHAAGWRSVYHDETLAVGLAPEDLKTMLGQRLRWAQGTMQVMLRENPLFQRGLSVAQRLMYVATMWTYLSGFAAVIYVAAPVLYLTFGVLPVRALSSSFFIRLVPFLVFNQVLFYLVGRGRKTWRGQQYSLALFPIWIRSVTSAIANVALGRRLSFAVTPKTKQARTGPEWHLIRPQLVAMTLLLVAAVVGTVRWCAGRSGSLATGLNIGWVAFDLCLFAVLIRAVRYEGFEPGEGVDMITVTAPTVSASPSSTARAARVDPLGAVAHAHQPTNQEKAS